MPERLTPAFPASRVAWPWGAGTFKPSEDRRRDMVKAAALLLAEIERLDRIGLIRSWPVRRDENGMFQHPDMPDFEEGEGDKCKAWIAQQGLQVAWSAWNMPTLGAASA